MLNLILEIEQIPVKDIAALRRATVIDLSSNNIRFLPVSFNAYITVISTIRILCVYVSRLFQKNFGSSLVHIVRLDLSKNQLKYLTDDFCNLVNLKHIDLYNNQLENLPVQFGKLTKLQYLDLKGNPLQPSLQKVVGPCITLKDCQNAAKDIVPFMCELYEKIQIEQKRKEKEEMKRKEEELQQLKEQIRLSKKAARKERVMSERQEKARQFLLENDENPSTRDKETKNLSTSTNIPKSSSRSVFKWFMFIVLFIISVFVAFNVSPQSFDNFASIIPKNFETVLKSFAG